ncbi:MAG: hypothetical protein VW270_10370, partial [Candidatus Poseidoniales archaeon]
VSRRASRLSTDYSTKSLNKLTRRQAGIHKAVDKLTASKHESTEHPNCGTDDCCQQCDTAVVEEKHPALKRAGVQGFSKPKRTPGHPTKSHVVVVKDGSKVKTIRFGEQGAETAGDPKKGESDRMKKKRKSFKARHGKNIAKGKTSAAYWANKVKW